MLVHTLPIGTFLTSLLSAGESCGYLGAVVILARTRDAEAQHRELTDDWTSVHDVTGPALAVLCPVPPHAWPRSVRHPTEPGRGVVAEGITLEVPYERERFEGNFWNDLPRRPGWNEVFVMPARLAPAEVHASGWTQAVTDAAEFFGIGEAHVPCLVVLSMGERHGTVIPIDESFGVYNFLKKLMERVGSAPVSLGKSLDKRRQLRRWIAENRTGLEPARVRSLSRKLAEAEVLAPRLIADCRTRVETLTQTVPSEADLRALRAVSDLLRSPQRQAERHNLRIRGLLSRLDRVIGTLETQRPRWEESRRAQEALVTVEHEVTVLRDEVASISLAALLARVAAELPHPLDEKDVGPAPRLPGWSFSRLGRRPTYAVQTTAAAERVGRLGLVGEVWRELRAPKAEKLRVLMLAASSHGDLRVGREQKLIRAALGRATHRDQVKLDVRTSATTGDLLDGITRFRPHVVHFSGHSSKDRVGFDQDVDDFNEGLAVTAGAFARAIKATDEPPLLVLLNSCHSAAQIDDLVDDVVPFAIGMSDEIGDIDAMTYAAQFYAAVAEGQSIASAHASGRAAIELAGLDDHELPTLAWTAGVDPGATKLVRMLD